MCEVNVNTENLKSVIADLESLTNHLKAMLQDPPESKTAQKNPDSKKTKTEKKNCSLEEVRRIQIPKKRRRKRRIVLWKKSVQFSLKKAEWA